jgi:hypothetical protein
MALPVVTTAAGGMPIVDMTGTALGLPVSEATNGKGLPVSKVVGKPGLPVNYTGNGGAASVPAAFDGVGTNVTLSNGNRTATHINATTNSGARSTVLKTTGKYYFEMTPSVSAALFNGAGILTSTGTYADALSVLNCTLLYMQGGIYSNGVSTGKTVGTVAIGTAIGFAIDLTARLGWIRNGAGPWNGDGAANPATGAGGVTITPTASFSPMVAFDTGPGDVMTINCGQAAYVNAAPSGFGNWTS